MIVDHLYDQPSDLLTCALVARTWITPARYHYFKSITIIHIPPRSSSGATRGPNAGPILRWAGFIENIATSCYIRHFVETVQIGREDARSVTTPNVDFLSLDAYMLNRIINLLPNLKVLKLERIALWDVPIYCNHTASSQALEGRRKLKMLSLRCMASLERSLLISERTLDSILSLFSSIDLLHLDTFMFTTGTEAHKSTTIPPYTVFALSIHFPSEEIIYVKRVIEHSAATLRSVIIECRSANSLDQIGSSLQKCQVLTDVTVDISLIASTAQARDTGLLGNVPQHWELLRLAHLPLLKKLCIMANHDSATVKGIFFTVLDVLSSLVPSIGGTPPSVETLILTLKLPWESSKKVLEELEAGVPWVGLAKVFSRLPTLRSVGISLTSKPIFYARPDEWEGVESRALDIVTAQLHSRMSNHAAVHVSVSVASELQAILDHQHDDFASPVTW